MKEISLKLSITTPVQDGDTSIVSNNNVSSKVGIVEVYKVIAAQRASRDTMVWQTVSIGIAAQSFLYAIALGGQTSEIGRFIALTLSFVTAVVTLQLFAKQRFMEMRDSEILIDFECQIWPEKFENNKQTQKIKFWPTYKAQQVNLKAAPHSAPDTSTAKCYFKRLYLAGSSYRIWCYCFWFIVFLSLFLGAIIYLYGDAWLISKQTL